MANPLRYFCLENTMERGALWATVHRVTESDTIEATEHTHMHTPISVYGQEGECQERFP